LRKFTRQGNKEDAVSAWSLFAHLPGLIEMAEERDHLKEALAEKESLLARYRAQLESTCGEALRIEDLEDQLTAQAEELAALRNVAEELLEDTPEFVGGCCLPSYCSACGGEDETHAPICPRVSLRAALDALPKEGTK
jgi:hypothetical protein